LLYIYTIDIRIRISLKISIQLIFKTATFRVTRPLEDRTDPSTIIGLQLKDQKYRDIPNSIIAVL